MNITMIKELLALLVNFGFAFFVWVAILATLSDWIEKFRYGLLIESILGGTSVLIVAWVTVGGWLNFVSGAAGTLTFFAVSGRLSDYYGVFGLPPF